MGVAVSALSRIPAATPPATAAAAAPAAIVSALGILDSMRIWKTFILASHTLRAAFWTKDGMPSILASNAESAEDLASARVSSPLIALSSSDAMMPSISDRTVLRSSCGGEGVGSGSLGVDGRESTTVKGA